MKTTFFYLLVALVAIQGAARAEVPLLSPDELLSTSSNIVVGEVRAVYSTIERSKDFESSYSVAEISVTSAERGDAIYRVEGDTFVEVRGMLVDDDTRTAIFAWERVKE